MQALSGLTIIIIHHTAAALMRGMLLQEDLVNSSCPKTPGVVKGKWKQACAEGTSLKQMVTGTVHRQEGFCWMTRLRVLTKLQRC